MLIYKTLWLFAEPIHRNHMRCLIRPHLWGKVCMTVQMARWPFINGRSVIIDAWWSVMRHCAEGIGRVQRRMSHNIWFSIGTGARISHVVFGNVSCWAVVLLGDESEGWSLYPVVTLLRLEQHMLLNALIGKYNLGLGIIHIIQNRIPPAVLSMFWKWDIMILESIKCRLIILLQLIVFLV